jgi:hypothetical protein
LFEMAFNPDFDKPAPAGRGGQDRYRKRTRVNLSTAGLLYPTK